MTLDDLKSQSATAAMAIRMGAAERGREAEREARCLARMGEIVKAARIGRRVALKPIEANEIADYLRDYASRSEGARIVEMMSRHGGMVHNS